MIEANRNINDPYDGPSSGLACRSAVFHYKCSCAALLEYHTRWPSPAREKTRLQSVITFNVDHPLTNGCLFFSLGNFDDVVSRYVFRKLDFHHFAETGPRIERAKIIWLLYKKILLERDGDVVFEQYPFVHAQNTVSTDNCTIPAAWENLSLFVGCMCPSGIVPRNSYYMQTVVRHTSGVTSATMVLQQAGYGCPLWRRKSRYVARCWRQ